MVVDDVLSVVVLDDEVYDDVDEETLSLASEDVELVLDDEVEGEPIDQNLINNYKHNGGRQSI